MAEKKKRRLEVRLNVGKVRVGEAKRPTSRRSRAKPRTSHTYNNKLRKLKSKYNRLFRNSQKAKEKGGKEPFFCDNYPDFDKFLSKINLKKAGAERETVSKSTKSTNVGGILGSY